MRKPFGSVSVAVKNSKEVGIQAAKKRNNSSTLWRGSPHGVHVILLSKPAQLPHLKEFVMQSYIETDLLHIVSEMGSVVMVNDPNGIGERPWYHKNENTKVRVDDVYRLIRKMDDPQRTIDITLANWSFLQNHLFPLLVTYTRVDKDLVYSVIRLLYILTLPANESAENHDKQITALQKFKEAFLEKDVIGIIMLLLTEPLKDPTDNNNKHFISYILGIVKHVLSVPDPAPNTSSATAHLSQLQYLIVESLHKFVFFDVLLMLMHKINKQNQDWALLILDIVYLIFRCDDPVDIIAGDIKLGGTPDKKKAMTARHPNFGGVFVTTNANGNRAISNASYAKHNKTACQLPPLQRPPVRHGRNKPPPPVRKSPGHMRPILGFFTEKILSAGFNELIVEVFENLKKGSLSQAVVETDYDHFFWAVSFFVGYNYHNEIKKVTANSVAFDVGAVSGALGFPIFGFIFDKIKENDLLRRYHQVELGFKAYSSMLQTLVAMSKYGDNETKRVARHYRATLFYEVEEDSCLDFSLPFARKWTPGTHTKEYLIAHFEIIHSIVLLMETEGGTIITKKKTAAQRTTTAGDSVREGKEGEEAQKQEEEEEEERRFAEEKQLSVLQFIRRIASNKLINLYLYLLMDYATNPQHVNHIIVKMLTFIARECKLYALFIKVSTLRLLNEILSETSEADPKLREVRNFCKYIVRRLYDSLAAKGPEVVGIQALFPKSRKVAYQYLDLPPEDISGFIAGEEDPDATMTLENGEEEEEEYESVQRRKKLKSRMPQENQKENENHSEEEEDDIDFDDFDLSSAISEQSKVNEESDRAEGRKEWSEDETEKLLATFKELDDDGVDDIFDALSGLLLMSGVDASPAQCYMQLKRIGELPEAIITAWELVFSPAKPQAKPAPKTSTKRGAAKAKGQKKQRERVRQEEEEEAPKKRDLRKKAPTPRKHTKKTKQVEEVEEMERETAEIEQEKREGATRRKAPASRKSTKKTKEVKEVEEMEEETLEIEQEKRKEKATRGKAPTRRLSKKNATQTDEEQTLTLEEDFEFFDDAEASEEIEEPKKRSKALSKKFTKSNKKSKAKEVAEADEEEDKKEAKNALTRKQRQKIKEVVEENEESEEDEESKEESKAAPKRTQRKRRESPSKPSPKKGAKKEKAAITEISPNIEKKNGNSKKRKADREEGENEEEATAPPAKRRKQKQ